MSPSEFDLRAALREGEGDGVDAGRLIANAARIRSERHRRINTGLGIAAVVGVIGTAGALIGTNVSNNESAGGTGAARTQAVAGGAVSGNATVVPAPAPSRAVRHGGNDRSTPACPATPVHVLRPGGTTTADHNLFPADVGAISACGYPAKGTTIGGAFLTGTAAQAMARALDSAPERPADRHGNCVAPFDGRGTVQLRVYDASGTAGAPVTVAPDCTQAKVTNGTVTKYPRHLPAPLPSLLRAVR